MSTLLVPVPQITCGRTTEKGKVSHIHPSQTSTKPICLKTILIHRTRMRKVLFSFPPNSPTRRLAKSATRFTNISSAHPAPPFGVAEPRKCNYAYVSLCNEQIGRLGRKQSRLIGKRRLSFRVRNETRYVNHALRRLVDIRRRLGLESMRTVWMGS